MTGYSPTSPCSFCLLSWSQWFWTHPKAGEEGPAKSLGSSHQVGWYQCFRWFFGLFDLTNGLLWIEILSCTFPMIPHVVYIHQILVLQENYYETTTRNRLRLTSARLYIITLAIGAVCLVESSRERSDIRRHDLLRVDNRAIPFLTYTNATPQLQTRGKRRCEKAMSCRGTSSTITKEF